jgi:hypothetical protein
VIATNFCFIKSGVVHGFIKEGKQITRWINEKHEIIGSIHTHKAGSSTEVIEWNQAAAKGIYNLQIAQPDGSTKVIRIKY